MQESGQPFGSPVSRPMARPSAAPAPIQRGNYGGMPSRPAPVQATPMRPMPAIQTQPVAQPEPAAPIEPTVSTPPPQPVAAPAPTPVVAQPAAPAPPRPVTAPSSPQFMDFAPRPSSQAQPQAQPQIQTISAQRQPLPEPQPVTPTLDQRPLFTPSAEPVAKTPQHNHKPKMLSVVRIGLICVTAILLIAGVVRFTSAGSTAKDTIAVGAVSANDGRSMTIQFTATDGKVHKFSTKSNRDLIPGTAVEVAYRSGAPEATVRQVSIVKQNRNFGITLILAGFVTLASFGVVNLAIRIKNRDKRHGAPLTKPVTV